MLPYFWFVTLVNDKPKFKWVCGQPSLPTKAHIVREILSTKIRSLKSVEEATALVEQYLNQSGYYKEAIASWRDVSHQA